MTTAAPSWLTSGANVLPQANPAFPHAGVQLDANQSKFWTGVKVLGVGALFGYPLYKIYVDKKSEVSGKAVLGWAFVGLTCIMVADNKAGCNPSKSVL